MGPGMRPVFIKAIKNHSWALGSGLSSLSPSRTIHGPWDEACLHWGHQEPFMGLGMRPVFIEAIKIYKRKMLTALCSHAMSLIIICLKVICFVSWIWIIIFFLIFFSYFFIFSENMPNSIPNGDVSKIVSFVKGRETNGKEKVSFEKRIIYE